VALHLSNSQRLKLQAQKIVKILAGTGTQGGAAVRLHPAPPFRHATVRRCGGTPNANIFPIE
jgi:hypothetical protein